MYVSHTDLHRFPSESRMTKPVAHGSLVRKSFNPASNEPININDGRNDKSNDLTNLTDKAT